MDHKSLISINFMTDNISRKSPFNNFWKFWHHWKCHIIKARHTQAHRGIHKYININKTTSFRKWNYLGCRVTPSGMTIYHTGIMTGERLLRALLNVKRKKLHMRSHKRTGLWQNARTAPLYQTEHISINHITSNTKNNL